jgi:hypothetical protein
MISEVGYGETMGYRRWLWGYSGYKNVVMAGHIPQSYVETLDIRRLLR